MAPPLALLSRAFSPHPLVGRAFRAALFAVFAVALAAGLGAIVRLLPWLLDPAVTFRLAAPFARGVLMLSLEAALVVGWPLGWALACVSLVDRGEARALATLGQSPQDCLVRLTPQAALLACALGVVSFAGGKDASAPGLVVSDLIARGRETCEAASEPETYTVPFASVTWLCAPGFSPRLVGRGPGPLAKAGFTARSAHASGDLREIDLEGAHLHLPLDAGKGTEPNAGPGIDVAVGSLRLRGLSPFTHASSVPPLGRAIALALAVTLAAAFCVVGVLSGALRGRLHAIVTAATGSLATLGTMRAIDRAGGTGLATILVPSAALAALLLVAVVSSRLPRGRWAATK